VLAYLLTAYTCAIGGRYEHYYIVFSPLLVLVYACLLYLLKIDTVWKRAIVMAFIIGFGGIEVIRKYKFVYVDKTVPVVVNLVEKHSRPEDTMMGDSLVNRAIYAYADRKCVNKYLSNAYSPDITEEVLAKMPKIIVHVKTTPLDDSILKLYSLAESYKEYEIYVRN
jgi:PII-like signaling protein